jgi:hypothetical protein
MRRFVEDLELRRATAYYNIEWYHCCDDENKGDMAFNHVVLIRTADYLEAAGGSCEIATARLLRVLRRNLLALQAQAFDDDGPSSDDPEDDPPPQPLPPKILAAFRLKEPSE